MTSLTTLAASPAGTRGYFERLKTQGLPVTHGPLGFTELQVSRVGFGGYRLHEFEPDHREALKLAIQSGCNLVDTSSNYTEGSSERLIGEVVRELIDAGQIKREEIVIVTKAGYVQGATLRDARARQERGTPYPEMVEYQSDCWHNISPEFLEAQITQSLERMKLDCIDVVLVHNPEYYMKSNGSREVYYARLEKAFRHLESEVSKGRIRYYGVSSNTFPEAESRSDFTNLSRLLDIVKTIGKPNHFAVVELPFNLYESGAALVPNNNRQTVMQFAHDAKLGVLTNRPFNSLNRGRLVRLTSFPVHDEVEVKGGLHTVLGRAVELEKKAPGYPKSHQGFQWAHVLREKLGDLDDVLAWRDALYQQVLPSIRQALSKLGPDREQWAHDFQVAMQELLRLVTRDLENLGNQKSKMIEEQLAAQINELGSSPTLSQKVLRVYEAFPQLSSVLVGMRTPNYVRDVMAAQPALDIQRANELLTKLQKHKS